MYIQLPDNHFNFLRPKWILSHGTKYKVGCVLWIGHNEEETPNFVLLKEICMVERNLEQIWFITDALHTVSFVSHLNAYEVTRAADLKLVNQQHLVYPFPLHLITVTVQGQVKTVVCPKYQVAVL